MENEWLRQGGQAVVTPQVVMHIDDALDMGRGNPISERPLMLAYQIANYIGTLPKMAEYFENPANDDEREANECLKEAVFRQRTADQILGEGVFPTCSDTAVLFRAFMLALEVPVSYVETFHKDYIWMGKSNFHTHSVNRIFTEDGSFIVDPKPDMVVYENDNVLPYVIVKEGLDCWDIGLKSYEDLHSFLDEKQLDILAELDRASKLPQKKRSFNGITKLP